MWTDILKEISQYSILIILSFWAGIAKYLGSLVKDPSLKFSFKNLLYDVIICGFVGVVVIMICYSQKLGIYETGAIVAVSAHMGTKAITLLEEIVKGFLGKVSNASSKDKTKP